MKKQDLVEWIIENGTYLVTVREDTFKINLYRVKKDHWEIYFNLRLNCVTRAGKVTLDGMNKFLPMIDF